MPAERPDRGLAPLLLLLTVVSGVVDAVSFLKLGHVFVANMTGNVVFLGFAVAGATEVSLPASIVAIAFFLAGGLAAGRVAGLIGGGPAVLLRTTAVIQLVLFGGCAAASAVSAGTAGTGAQHYVLIAALAVAMGMQNASARRVAIPDLTTTVLTMTLTGIAADSALAGGHGSRLSWRLGAVASMLAGALAGGLLVLHVSVPAALGLAAILLAAVALGAHRLEQRS